MGSFAKFFVILFVSHEVVFAEWTKFSSDYFNMNVLCAQCGELCERVPYVNLKDTESVEAQHWACYIGCRTTCLLQVGRGQQKYDFESAKRLCVKGCHEEFKATEDVPTLYSLACSNACASKVIPPPLSIAETEKVYSQQLPADEPDEILLDPALREQYFRSGGNLPHSKYQTLPRRNHRSMEMYSSLTRRLSGSSFNEYVVNFIKDHRSDFLLAVASISLSLLSGILLYYFVFYSSLKKVLLQASVSETTQEQQPVTVLRVELESESETVPPKSKGPDHEFIPPPSPPPKYSDIVQTV